jgi:U4/U6 small nuclear ribonucleoprotein PRP31
VRNSPRDIQRQALRVLAAKVALAARVDSCQEDTTGDLGRRVREEIVKKLEKLQEPPPPKKPKVRHFFFRCLSFYVSP